MKKIFTLAAAVLASVTMMAQDAPSVDVEAMTDAASETYFTSYNGDAVTLSLAATYETFNNAGGYYVKLDQTNNTAYVGVTAQQEITKVAFLVTGNGDNKNINAGLIGYTEVTENPDFAHVDYATNIDPAVAISSKYYENAQWVEFDLTGLELKAIYFAKQWKNVYIGESTSKASYPSGNAQSLFVYGIRVWAGAAVPMTDPVTSVEISGPKACYVNQKATYSATTDVKANAYKWFVNGTEQAGATRKNFEFTPDAVGTYAISCSAKNDNNSDFVASNVINLVVTERELVDQVSISEATTWDWTKAASVSEIKWTAESEPYKKNVDTVVMANIEGMNNNDDFNSQALLFNGEYPVRSGQYAQGNMISFTTTVPGYVKVDFSNTGTKDVARYVAVNGVVNTTVGTLNQDRVSSAYIPVAAGEVKIEGSFENYSDGVQYLHFFQIVFGTGDVPTAINNTEAAVKAVKVVRNGQLFIEKNGVVYNVLGSTVR